MANGEKAPYFKLWVFDWSADFVQQSLDAAGAGILIRLMVLQWIEGSLPDDPEELRLYCRASEDEWERAWSKLEKRFELSLDGRRRHARLEDERADMVELARKRKKQATLAAKARYASSMLRASKRSMLRASREHANHNQNHNHIDLSNTDQRSNGTTKPLSDMSGSGSEPKTAPPIKQKRFWWDDERKRIWGTDEARAKLKATWKAHGLSDEEIQTQLKALDRWLETRPEKRREGANLANRVNNWLNNYLMRLEEKAT